MLVLIAAEVEKHFAGIRYVGSQIIGANIWSQPHTLDSKARFVMKLKNTARGRRSRRLLETGAANVANDEPSVCTFKQLGIMCESRNLKATDALQRPANEVG